MRSTPAGAPSLPGAALAALAAGAAAGLAAAAGSAVLRRMLRHPVITSAVPEPDQAGAVGGPGAGGSAPVTAIKDVADPLPGWKEVFPAVRAAPVEAVEVTPLDAPSGVPLRTWVVQDGSEWEGDPGELMIPQPDPRQGGRTAGR